MIKRENFIRIIESIRNQIEKERELVDKLKPYFDGMYISMISEEMISTLIKVLEDEMGDVADEYGTLISWWMFDAPDFGRKQESAYINVYDKKVLLRDAGELYDYMVIWHLNMKNEN